MKHHYSLQFDELGKLGFLSEFIKPSHCMDIYIEILLA